MNIGNYNEYIKARNSAYNNYIKRGKVILIIIMIVCVITLSFTWLNSYLNVL